MCLYLFPLFQNLLRVKYRSASFNAALFKVIFIRIKNVQASEISGIKAPILCFFFFDKSVISIDKNIKRLHNIRLSLYCIICHAPFPANKVLVAGGGRRAFLQNLHFIIIILQRRRRRVPREASKLTGAQALCINYPPQLTIKRRWIPELRRRPAQRLVIQYPAGGSVTCRARNQGVPGARR